MNKRRRLIVALGASAFVAPFSSVGQQQTKIPRIGFLGATSAATYASRLDAFRTGLREYGYVEGKTIHIDFRWAEGDYSRLPQLASELVNLNVDLILTHATNGARAAKQATSTIPIVVAVTGDAIGNGIVTNLARPEGNLTGSTFFQPEILAKRMELMKEVAPHITEVAFLLNGNNPGNTGPTLRAMELAAKPLKVHLQQFPVANRDEFENAFIAMKKSRANAVVTSEDPLTIAHIKTVSELANRHRLLSAGSIDSAEAGGLIGYGVNTVHLYKRAAYFVDKILKGSKPGDLPMKRPTKFELVVNMKTAKALGLTIPQSLLISADKVIE